MKDDAKEEKSLKDYSVEELIRELASRKEINAYVSRFQYIDEPEATFSVNLEFKTKEDFKFKTT